MRAVDFREPSERVVVEEVELAAPGPGDVRVRITAAGVCHSDLHVRDGDWKLPVPLILGHEGSGTIVETGPDVLDLGVGDHVVLSWVAPCGTCLPCRLGRPVRCLVASNVVARGGVLNDGTSRLTISGARRTTISVSPPLPKSRSCRPPGRSRCGTTRRWMSSR